MECSRLAQHESRDDYCVVWNLAITLQIEHNSVYKKYKEEAHVSCLKNHIMQPSLKIWPIWFPLPSEREYLCPRFHRTKCFPCQKTESETASETSASLKN
jgi:hypothetical protein